MAGPGAQVPFYDSEAIRLQLLTTGHERRIGKAKDKGTDFNHYMEQAQLKKTCKHMRLVCKDFSRLHAVNSALFHTVHLTPSTHSLGKATALCSHGSIRGFVRNIVFTMPQLPSALAVEQFDKELRNRLIWEYDSILKYDPQQANKARRLPLHEEDLTAELAEPRDAIWPERSERARFLTRKYFDTVYLQEKRTATYKSITRAIEEQRVLCEEGAFVQLAGSVLAELPNTMSVSVRRGCGTDLDSMVDGLAGPRIVWGGSDWIDEKWTVDFMTLVLQTLAVSKTKISHLVSEHPTQISRKLRLPRPVDTAPFSTLQTIGLELNDDKPEPWTPQDWHGFLHPLLAASADSLQNLALERNRHAGCYETHGPCPAANLDSILSLTFPALRRLELTGAFDTSTTCLPSFLKRHPHLEELHLPFKDHEIEPGRETWRPDEWWLALFEAVRCHPRLRVKNVTFKVMQDSFLEHGISPEEVREARVYPTKNSPPWCWDLDAYLKSGGPWTTLLEDKFGAMV